MTRQSLFSGVWDGDNEEAGTRRRVFWRPDDARMGATLYQLAPGTPESRMHMHYGAEEMFFVLSGRPSFRNQSGEEALAPGDVVFCPEGRAGLHTFSNPTDEPAEILAISAGSFPDVVAYPEHGYAWVAIPIPTSLRRAAIPASSPGSKSRSSSRLEKSQADIVARPRGGNDTVAGSGHPERATCPGERPGCLLSGAPTSRTLARRSWLPVGSHHAR
jgi:mannose-6-phosphate isomerase-like protein (cupin superfamily)